MARRAVVLLGRLLASVGVAVVFVLAVAVGALLHADSPAARRLAGRFTTDWLSELFRGTVRVEGIQHLSTEGLTVERLTLVDDQGRTVLVLHDVTGHIELGTLLSAVLGDAPKVTIVVPHVRAERAEVLVTPDPVTHEASIARALAPALSAGPSAEGTPSRDVRVWLPEIEVGSATGSVDMADIPPFQGKVVGVHGKVLVTSAGVAVDVQRFGANLRRRDGTEARGTATLSVRAPGPIRGSFEGFYGDVEVQVRVSLRRDRLEGTVSLPGASPEAMKALVPGWPLRERVAGRVEVSGLIPSLAVNANLTVGKSTIKVEGTTFVEKPLQANLAVEGQHLDLRALVPDAPETDLDLSGDIQIDEKNGRVLLELGARTEPTNVAGQSIPAAEVEGVLQDGQFAGKAKILEPGLPLEVAVNVSRDGVVELQAHAKSFDTRNIERVDLGVAARGSAQVSARIQKGEVDARYSLSLRDVQADKLRFGTLEASGTARGVLEDLKTAQFIGRASAKNAALGAFSADSLTGSFSGRWPTARFEARAETGDARTMEARGNVSFGEQVALRDLALAIRDKDVYIHGKVDQFVPEAGIVDVDRFVVEGVGGSVEGSLRLGKDLLETRVDGEGIDIGRIAAALGLPRRDIEGKVRIHVDFVAGRDVTRGRLSLRLGNATLGPVTGVSLDLRANVDGERVTAETSGLVANVGTFGGSSQINLAGFVLERESWDNATGQAELTLSELNLPLLALLLGPDAAAAPVAGRGYVQLRVERRNPKDLPNLLATATTRGLEIAIAAKDDSPPRHVKNVDVHATGALNGATGDSSGTVLVVDDVGELFTTSGAVKVDVEALSRAPSKAGEQLLTAPLDLLVRMPPRAFSQLPEPLRTESLAGTLQATLQVRGRLSEPILHLLASATNVGGIDDPGGTPVNIDVDAQYDPIAAYVQTGVRASVQGRPVAKAEGEARRQGELWVGQTRIDLDGLPLTAIPALSRADLHGLLYGNAVLERTTQTRRLDADIALRQGAVGRAPIDEARVRIHTTNQAARLDLRIVSATGDLVADATLPMDWSAPVPRPRPAEAITARIRARRFDAAALAPLVEDVLDRLGGAVEADLTLRLEPPDDDESSWQGALSGVTQLKQGYALVKALGMEVRSVRFDATFREQRNRTSVSVKNIRGQVRSTSDNVVGDATLELAGLRVVSGTANLKVDDLPLLVEGVSQGLATGRATARLTRRPEHMLVEVNIPEMLTKLPRSSSRKVIDLDDNENVLVFQTVKEEGTGNGEAFPWQIVVRFGDRVRIRQSDIDIGIRGSPIVELGNRTDVFGTVELSPGGRVPILGKVFVIESGFVHFDTGQPGNPRLDVTASWRSPGDTMVYVDVTGTLKDSNIVLRSDPPLPEPEVFALIMGGPTADPNAETTSGNTGSAAGAVGLGSGVAALGVSELLLGESPVTLSVGTTSESRPRYTAAVRIGQDLWFEASTYERASSGANNDARSVFSGTIDYRFTRNWSLRTEVGTAGGVMDLLWQYRY